LKFIANNIMLIGLIIGSGFMLIWPTLKKGAGGANNVKPAQAVMLINRSHAIVIDVRDDTEFAAGHITDAKNIPLAQLSDRLKELQRFKDKPILVNCQAGARSAKACAILLKNEFKEIHNLEGGINAWVEAKLPVIKNN
jgi:rhodanese-related sulfurtransferase